MRLPFRCQHDGGTLIHYHGCPITPRAELLTLSGRFFCNSFADPRDTKTCHGIGQGNMLDNGAYTLWTQGREPDWHAWAEWVQPWLDYHTTWAVLPDVIDGGAHANRQLIEQWHAVSANVAPVWHLDEPLEWLLALAWRFPRVCFGSAGAYREIGTPQWHRRIADAFNALVDQDGRVRVWVHMLRGLDLAGDIYPFASADSTNAARNFKGSHRQRSRLLEAMVAEIDARQCPARWTPWEQMELEVAA